MKRITKYGLALFSLVLLFSCEEFLVKEPPLYLTEQEVFEDPERLDAEVVGLYQGLKSQYVLGGKILPAIDNIGDDLINISGNGYELMNTYNGNVGPGIQENYETWRYTYLAINRANVFLSNLETYKAAAGDKYEQYVAEAKFVRALAYYYLHQLYTMPYVLDPNAKSVPLRIEAEVTTQNNDLARSSSQQVLDQILSDLSASSALPARNGSNAVNLITRATQGAAETLKQRIYLIMGDWDKAIEAGNKVTGYALADDITSLFKTPYITSENIFTLPFDATNRGTGQYYNGYFYINGKSVILDATSGFITIDGYNNPKDDRVGKFTAAVANKGIVYTKYTSSTYVDWLHIFRYAEVLLNLSEAYANKGQAAEALGMLKQVRARSLDPADDTLALDGLTGEALKTAIYNERRIELFSEGIRGFDILRRGETIQKQFGDENMELVIPPSRGITGYIWPIPTMERDQNSLIVD
jgi:tetratricopeptide (TPR) repeat protein